MASPHVAGRRRPLTSRPTRLRRRKRWRRPMLNLATPDNVSGAGAGSPNLLLYSLFDGGHPSTTRRRPRPRSPPPSDGATVSGTSTIQADAMDAVGVERVEFHVDGGLECTDTSEPYTCSWDTTTVADGPRQLQTKAFDAAGNMGTSTPVSVTVSNTAPAPAPELVQNGGFEEGTSHWSLVGDVCPGDRTLRPHGRCLPDARRCATTPTGLSPRPWQSRSPPRVPTPFWLGVGTSERGKSVTDFLYVEVVSSDRHDPACDLQQRRPGRSTSRRASTSPPGAARPSRCASTRRPTDRGPRRSTSTTSR